MSNTPRILLVLGAGSNLSPHLHRVFAARDYKVALASRKGGEGTGANTNEENVIHIKADFTDPGAVAKVFAKTKEAFGASPGVVVYNGMFHDCLISCCTERGRCFVIISWKA